MENEGEVTPPPVEPKRSQSPKTPRNILASIPPGKDIYSRSQRLLERKRNRNVKKKKLLEEEELQEAPKINTNSLRMMKNRQQPAWMRSATDSPVPNRNGPRHVGVNGRSSLPHNKDLMIRDVMQACISADQAVERILASPSPERITRSRTPTTRPTKSVKRSSSAGASHSHVQTRPEFYIQRNTDHNTPDIFVTAGDTSAPDHDRVAIVQNKRISELEDTVHYLASLLGIDVQAERAKQKKQRRSFFESSATIWRVVLSYLPLPATLMSRTLGGSMSKAGDSLYKNWFLSGSKRTFRVNNHIWSSLWVPGGSTVKILIDHVEAVLSGGSREDEIHDGMVLDAPFRLEVRGNGEIGFITAYIPSEVVTTRKVNTPTDSLSLELPQGSVDISSIDCAGRKINAKFSHARWYPLPGDTVVLISVGTEIPPLTPVISDIPDVLSHLPNDGSENPWEFTLPYTPPEGAASCQYELRYVDSLGRPLATSKPFSL